MNELLNMALGGIGRLVAKRAQRGKVMAKMMEVLEAVSRLVVQVREVVEAVHAMIPQLKSVAAELHDATAAAKELRK